MENKRIIPKEYIGMKIVERPLKFQAPQYTCAMTMDIVLFLSDQIYEDQMNWSLLNRRCLPVEHIICSVYPGGSGMKASILHWKLEWFKF